MCCSDDEFYGVGARWVATVGVDELEGFDAVAERAEEHAGGLIDAEFGDGRWTVKLFGGFVFFLFDEAEIGTAIAEGDGDEKVLSGVVSHFPESGRGGEGDLRLFVIEGGAERGDELRVFGLSGGEDGGGADIHVVSGDGISDEMCGARVGAHASECGHGHDAVVRGFVGRGVGGEHGPSLVCARILLLCCGGTDG